MKIKAKAPGSLIDQLLNEFKGISRSSVKKLIAHGNITVNGTRVQNPVFQVSGGDEIGYTKYDPGDSQGCPFRLLYEDEWMIFVDKPAGMLTYGERGSVGTSVYRELLGFLQKRSKGKERIFVVHRLDREVSGILLFAKSEEMQEKIKERWKETDKLYYALVEGRPPEKEGTVSGWLKETSTQKMYIAKGPDGAKWAVTNYRTLKEMAGHTFLEVKIETGRKNQIRVQLAGIGCPITGDRKYGSKDRYQRRIRLHAFRFSMPHPVSGERVEIESGLPRGFLSLPEKDEKYK
jgi:23S rRNA pseudouridine1911/1915/1917 synthase